MKEIFTIRRNLVSLHEQEGETLSGAEVVLLLCEPEYTLGADGKELVGRRVVADNVRFFADAKNLRNAARAFLSIAREIKAMPPKPAK